MHPGLKSEQTPNIYQIRTCPDAVSNDGMIDQLEMVRKNGRVFTRDCRAVVSGKMSFLP